MFVVMMPLYYIFFTSQIMNIVAIMTQITLILVVVMEYTYVVSGAPTFDSVEIVAGKVRGCWYIVCHNQREITHALPL